MARSSPARKGGWTHRPECECKICATRRRKEETLAQSTGAGWSPVESRKTPEAYTDIGKNATINEAIVVADYSQKRGAKEAIARWIELRTKNPGMTVTAAAEEMGVGRSFLYEIIHRSVKEGWLRFDDPIDKIEHQIIPKVLDNIEEFLDKKDKTVTIEAAKGVVWKTYNEVKGLQDVPNTILALKIEAVDPSQVKVISGTVVGKPRELKE